MQSLRPNPLLMPCMAITTDTPDITVDTMAILTGNLTKSVDFICFEKYSSSPNFQINLTYIVSILCFYRYGYRYWKREAESDAKPEAESAADAYYRYYGHRYYGLGYRGYYGHPYR